MDRTAIRRIRGASSDIRANWLLIGVLLVAAVVVGIAIARGMQKTATLLLLPPLVLGCRPLPERTKLGLAALSIPLSVVQIPSLPLPFGVTLVVVLALDEILFAGGRHKVQTAILQPAMAVALALFAFGGLVANRGGSLTQWIAYCLMPLFWFFLASRKIRDRNDAWLFVNLSLVAIMAFLGIVIWANATGHYESLVVATDGGWRLGYGLNVILGPIRLNVWSTILGSMASLGIPASVVLWISGAHRRLWRAIALVLLGVSAYVLISSAARGATVASILGVLTALVLSGRLRSVRFWGPAALLLVLLAVWSGTISRVLPVENIQYLETLLHDPQGIPNYVYRLNVLALAWKLTLASPLGVGFGTLWGVYGLDAAIIYAGILQGTGILGGMAFVAIVAQLAFRFGSALLRSSPGLARDLASIGLSTLVVGLVAGVSSSSILFEPVHAFVFWALMAVCYCASGLPRLPALN